MTIKWTNKTWIPLIAFALFGSWLVGALNMFALLLTAMVIVVIFDELIDGKEN